MAPPVPADPPVRRVPGSLGGHPATVPAPRTPIGRALADRGLLRPPTLQTEDSRGASRLELFFDLAFVLVIAELAAGLREDVTLDAALVTAGLFTVVWWAWMSATLYANRFDHDDVVFRANKLAGMLAVVGLAASVSDATGAYVTPFVLSYVGLRVLLLLQYARAHRHVEQAREGVRRYLLGTGAGAGLWLASLVVEGPSRYVLWALGLLVDAAAPLLVTASRTQVPLHVEHLPDRFSLFVILVLGESVAAVAHGVHDASWHPGSVLAGGVCFVIAAALWWSYFDLAGAGAKHLLEEVGGRTSTLSHDVYVYGQLPLCLSRAAVGIGIEGVVLEGTQEVGAGVRALLSGGVAVYLVTVGVTNAAMARGRRNGWWWAAAASVVAVGDALLDVPALGVAAVLAGLLVVVVVTGLEQEARGKVELEAL